MNQSPFFSAGRRALLLAGAALLTATAVPAAEAFKLDGPPKIAFIYAATARDGGWNEAMDNARQIVAQELGYPVAAAESIAEEASALKNAIDLYVQRGFNIIVTTSYGYSDGVLEAAQKYPGVAFLAASGTTNAANLESFYARTYEAWYLAGMAAGAVSQSKTLGMLGGFPVSVVNWDINGFTRGAQAVDPAIRTIALYTNSWWDPAKEGQAAQSILEQNADVIANNLSSAAPFTMAEKAGKASVGFQLDMSKLAPKGHLTSVVFHWDKHLVPTIRQIVGGQWTPTEHGAFPGMKEGVVDITPLGDKVPAGARERIAQARQQILDGSLAPFAGPLLKQNGEVAVVEGQHPDDATLWAMDYLIQGITGSVR
ncbi:BMP family ABC transporter substrate-binding protein [Corticibacter populi]|uniref:BMP family ABC transporter substrate-binding protein n=1 Tax=Corticibacter populi TaxID=1550736 RepID=A0A3M6QPF8_9BURK|nr:BMP family ABC transporter substrate-binding protein [Corticibacter populi]RMX04927.1 BMP family ABC transporter substrate-binding protein [Corticibacter populi]RZS33648.1 basic membrane lipoprotein Med (substrate-binding protein (PBP1-ABC) superfamily) [Corticibacter populi]